MTIKRGKPMINNTLKTLKGLSAAAKANKKADDKSKLADTPCGKYERTYNQREACEATGLHPRKIIAACVELDIPHRDEKRFCVDANDIAQLNKKHNPRRNRKVGSQPAIWAISQQKGGSGKTTLAVTIASGLAHECFDQLRIAVIDNDPQGTATKTIKPNFNDLCFSVGDLITGNYKLGAGETFETLCKNSFYETNSPNLRILGGRDGDRHYETFVERNRLKANQNNTSYSAYGDIDKIIDAVKDDFDIIIIDTSPYFSAATYTAHFSANNIMVPMKPSKNDTDSSQKYFEHLADAYEILAGMGHRGYENIIVQPAAVKQSVAHINAIAEIKATYGSHCSAYEFVDSDAILNCVAENSTIYDMSVSEFMFGSKKALKRAQTVTLQIVRDIEAKSIQFWEK
jgi:chromosome partitioning protein